jgi:tetratricopeptide (TPR) repeat protein
MRFFHVLLVSGLALASATTARAQPAEEKARIQFERGIELYEAGRFEQASIAFTRAYELKPSFKIMFNIGQAEAELEHYARALDAYTRYLAEGGQDVDPERLDQVKSEVKRLNALVGMIFLECPIDGALATVDGEEWGTTPIAGPHLVDVGKHEVLVKKGQQELLRRVVRIAGGQRVELKVEAGGEPVIGDDTGGAPEPTPAADDGPERVWTWVMLGVGGAAGIAGGVIGGVSMSREADLKSKCESQHCPASEKGEADTLERMNLTADILYGVAAAAVVTGIILFFVEPDDEGEAAVAVVPAATGDGAGVAVGGRF